MTTAVTGSPLGFTPCGQVMSNIPQRHLAGGSGEAGLTDAVKASGAVEAAAGVVAGPAGAVVHIDSAEASSEAVGAKTREAVDAIQAGGAVSTRLHQTVVHVGLTAQPREAHQTTTRQLYCKTISVFTQTAIFTGGPGDEGTQEDRDTWKSLSGFQSLKYLKCIILCVCFAEIKKSKDHVALRQVSSLDRPTCWWV